MITHNIVATEIKLGRHVLFIILFVITIEIKAAKNRGNKQVLDGYTDTSKLPK